MVIFDDADLNDAVAKVTAGLIVFAGQFCMTGSRAIVQRGIADRFRSALAEHLARINVGPASDPASEMGPLIDKPSVGRVNRMVEEAIAAGCAGHRAWRPGDGRRAGERRLLPADIP